MAECPLEPCCVRSQNGLLCLFIRMPYEHLCAWEMKWTRRGVGENVPRPLHFSLHYPLSPAGTPPRTPLPDFVIVIEFAHACAVPVPRDRLGSGSLKQNLFCGLSRTSHSHRLARDW